MGALWSQTDTFDVGVLVVQDKCMQQGLNMRDVVSVELTVNTGELRHLQHHHDVGACCYTPVTGRCAAL